MHVLKLRFLISRQELHLLDKRFRAMNRIHNTLVSRVKKLLNRIQKDHKYQDASNKYKELKALKKPTKDQKKEKKVMTAFMNQFREEIGLTKNGLYSYVKVIQKQYKHMLSSQQCQAEAERVWKSVESILFENGKDIHYRKLDDMYSIGGKSNTNGIKFDPIAMKFEWLGLRFSCKADWSDPYIREALCMDDPENLDISYCEMIRKPFKDGWHYYLIVVIKGSAPDKHKPIGDDKAGIDPGISTVACVTDNSVILKELAPNAKSYDKAIAGIQQQMDMAKRATNKDNFNPDGTVKTKAERTAAAMARAKRDRKPYNPKDYPEWIYSRHYCKLRWKMRDLYRKKHDCVKQSHERLADHILESAKDFYVEKNSFAAMAKRSKKEAEREEKKTEITKKNGKKTQIRKFKRKKRFGKSVNDRSPSLFLTILEKKCLKAGGTWQWIDTQAFKASQYRHDTGKCEKVPLSRRTKEICGHKVQRDLYSAFLIRNSVKNGTHPNRSRCKKQFPHFCEQQDARIASMKRTGSSMKQCFGF